MMPYASRTGTKRNLAALRAHGWRLLVVAGAVLRHEGFAYGLDNGAWSCHIRELPFDGEAFMVALDGFGAGADFVVAPDIVAGGLESLAMSVSWLDRCRVCPQVLIPVQDGMVPADVLPLLDERTGIFVGGTTEWKEATLPMWGAVKRATKCMMHVGRVNSRRRIRLCAMAGADSFDGTSVTRFAKTIHHLDAEVRQCSMILL